MVKKMWVQNSLWSKFWSKDLGGKPNVKNNFSRPKILLGPKKILGPIKFWVKKDLVQKTFWNTKILVKKKRIKKNVDQKHF